MLRGLVMIFMCIDHARDYTLHHPADPMVIDDTHWMVYLLRILAHTCAPTFVFLAGISAHLVGSRKTLLQLRQFLLTRGAVLCLLEVTLVNWGWSFNPTFHICFLQIIWATGIAMIMLAGAVGLPRKFLLILCILILGLHNLADGIRFEEGTVAHYLWSILLQKNLLPVVGDFMVRTTYPVLPVAAVMGLGYCAGSWYTSLDADGRRRKLWTATASLFALFLATRIVLGYGDPHAVESDHGIGRYLLSLPNATKYPMSLHFVLLYLSVTTAILALTEGRSFPVCNILPVLGRTPMFFYIIHLYVLHAIMLVYLAVNGHEIDLDATLGGIPEGTGYPLWLLFVAVAFTVSVLVIPCRKYYRLKASRRYRWTAYI